jgi:hypothetical protein
MYHLSIQQREQPDVATISRGRRKQGGPGRPFPKGVSGNAAGRPPRPIEQRAVEKDVRKVARQHGIEAVEKLVALMRGTMVLDVGDPENPKRIVIPVAPPTQLAAAVAILDRGYGRPGQAVEVTGADRSRLQHQEADPRAIIASRLAAIAERLREQGHPLLLES